MVQTKEYKFRYTEAKKKNNTMQKKPTYIGTQTGKTKKNTFFLNFFLKMFEE